MSAPLGSCRRRPLIVNRIALHQPASRSSFQVVSEGQAIFRVRLVGLLSVLLEHLPHPLLEKDRSLASPVREELPGIILDGVPVPCPGEARR